MRLSSIVLLFQFLVFALCACSLLASGQVIVFVASPEHGGNDATCGPASPPCATLARASQFQPDEVIFAPGIYEVDPKDTQDLLASKTSLLFRRQAPNDLVVLQAQGSAANLSLFEMKQNNQTLSIDGVQFVGFSSVVRSLVDSPSVVLSNVTVVGSIRAVEISSSTPSLAIIESLIRDCSGGAISVEVHAGQQHESRLTFLRTSLVNNTFSNAIASTSSGSVIDVKIIDDVSLDILVDGCTISNNGITAGFGGAVAIRTMTSSQTLASSINIQNSNFDRNFIYASAADVGAPSQVAFGAALFVNARASVVLSASTFSKNIIASTSRGIISGGGAISFSDIVSANISSCVFEGNSAAQGAGALQLRSVKSYVAVLDSTFSKNTALLGHGGAILAYSIPSFTISNVSFESNSAPVGAGGAVRLQSVLSGTSQGLELLGAQLSKTKFTGNSAFEGGAVSLQSQNVVDMVGCDFSANSALGGNGGAVAVAGRSIRTSANYAMSFGLQIVNSTFTGNSGVMNGGSIAILDREGWTSIQGCVFSRSNALASGGSLYSATDQLLVSKSKFIDSTSMLDGGCIALVSGQQVTWSESIATGCRAWNGAGGVVSASRVLDLAISNITTYNSSSQNGGSISCNSVDSCYVFGVNVYQAQAAQQGGAFECIASNCLLRELSTQTCKAFLGGSLFISSSLGSYSQYSISVRDSAFQSSIATSTGGGVFVDSLGRFDRLVLDNTIFKSCSASYGGSIAFSTVLDGHYLDSTVSIGSSVQFLDSFASVAGGCFFTASAADAIPESWRRLVKPGNSNALMYGPIIASNPSKVNLTSYAASKPLQVVPGVAFDSALNLLVVDFYDQKIVSYTEIYPQHPRYYLSFGTSDPWNINIFIQDYSAANPTLGFVGTSFPVSIATLPSPYYLRLSSSEVLRPTNASLFVVLRNSTCCGNDTFVQAASPMEFVATVHMQLQPCEQRRGLSLTQVDTDVAYGFSPKGQPMTWCLPSACRVYYYYSEYVVNVVNMAITNAVFSSVTILVDVVCFFFAFALFTKGLLRTPFLKLFAIFVELLRISTYLGSSIQDSVRQAPTNFLAYTPTFFDLPSLEAAAALITLQMLHGWMLSVLFLRLSGALAPLFNCVCLRSARRGRRRRKVLLRARTLIYVVTILLAAAILTIVWVVCRNISPSWESTQVAYWTIAILGFVPVVCSSFIYLIRVLHVKSWRRMQTDPSLELLQDEDENTSISTSNPSTAAAKVQAIRYKLRIPVTAMLDISCPIYFALFATTFEFFPSLALSLFNVQQNSACRALIHQTAMLCNLLTRILLPLAIIYMHKLPDALLPAFVKSSNIERDGLVDKELTSSGVRDVLKDLPSHMIIKPEDITFGEVIGQGAQGSVFLGQYDGAQVAIKTILAQSFGMESDLSDFFSEIELLSSLSHPYIIRMMGVCYDEQKDRLALVMEYCANGSLADLIAKQRSSGSGSGSITKRTAHISPALESELGAPSTQHISSLTFATKLKLLLGIVSGMSYIHNKHLIHRDLKAENVLLDAQLQVKLADFGLAKSVRQDTSNHTMKVGTASYVAPEVLRATTTSPEGMELQSKGEKAPTKQLQTPSSQVATYDSRCDVYSFGILMYVLLTENVRPYGPTVGDMQIILQVSRKADFRPSLDDPAVVSAINNNHKWYIDLMKRCWSFNPADRPTFDVIVKLLKNRLG